MNSKIVLLAVGGRAYLTKPIDAKEFLKMVVEKRG
jgi:DNA-binding response OmpR family regulator